MITKTQPKKVEFMHNRIMLALKIILEVITAETYLKNY
jgi:hypothetical protein